MGERYLQSKEHFVAYVESRQGEALDSVIRRFKRKLDAEGTLKTYRDKQYFKKPSVLKREKMKQEERRRKVEQLKSEKNKFHHKSKNSEDEKNPRNNRNRKFKKRDD